MRTSRVAPALFFAACLQLVAGCGGGGDDDDDLLEYDCSVFPPAATSPYVLPWTVGHMYSATPHAVVDTNHKKYAVDINMPIGTPILAIAGGAVVAVGESYVDGDHTPGHENFVLVDHGNGMAGGYGHLTYMGAVVQPGDVVQQGGLIGYSGDTGNSRRPHLHFDVIENCNVTPPVDLAAVNRCANIPLSFRNANPAGSCGLMYGVTYTAMPY